MEIAAIIAALLGVLGFAASGGGSDKDDEPDPVQPEPEPEPEDPVEEPTEETEGDPEEPVEEEPAPEEANAPALDIIFTPDANVSQSVIDAAAAAEEYMENLFLTAEEAGGQRTLEVRLSEDEIDGDGGTAGWGSVLSTYDDGSARSGEIRIDENDVGRMQEWGTMDELLEHELMHVMGFGLTWDNFDVLDTSDPDNPQFTGENAVRAYNEMTGGNHTGVPVDQSLAHWDMDAFDRDTMESTVYDGSDASEVTLASLLDIGIPMDLGPDEPAAMVEDDDMMVA